MNIDYWIATQLKTGGRLFFSLYICFDQVAGELLVGNRRTKDLTGKPLNRVCTGLNPTLRGLPTVETHSLKHPSESFTHLHD